MVVGIEDEQLAHHLLGQLLVDRPVHEHGPRLEHAQSEAVSTLFLRLALVTPVQIARSVDASHRLAPPQSSIRRR